MRKYRVERHLLYFFIFLTQNPSDSARVWRAPAEGVAYQTAEGAGRGVRTRVRPARGRHQSPPRAVPQLHAPLRMIP